MIVRSNFARFILAGIALGALSAAAAATNDGYRSPPGTPPTPETRQKVWHAVIADLRVRGLAERQLPQLEDLNLPGALPSLAGLSLQVTAACWEERPQRAQFRLDCGEPGQCLPFLAFLRHDEGDNTHSAIPIDADTRFGSCQPTLQSHKVSAAPTSSLKPAIRPGDKATAVFLSDNFRMTATVTCLDRGHEGEIIRVRNQNGQVFRARISGPGQLSALP